MGRPFGPFGWVVFDDVMVFLCLRKRINDNNKGRGRRSKCRNDTIVE